MGNLFQVVYTLICEPLDNPLLASNFLTLFVHELSDHFRKARLTEKASAHPRTACKRSEAASKRLRNEAGSMVDEVSSRPDEILTILNLMLPGGQLIFTNSNLHRHFIHKIYQAPKIQMTVCGLRC